ncbi:MAG TPA: polysaccharide deacetylase family protein [Polyangia bacterium]|nr:polysaccharide deacetylase family protein [Polyangia bacterium]
MSAAILMYHRVAELSPDTFGLCTPPEIFRQHLEHVATSYTPMALDELGRRAAAGRLPHRAVAITLDDGYLDNLAAAHLLREFWLPATFFINEPSDQPREFWWDVLERALLGPHAVPSAFRLDAWLPAVTAADRLAAFRAIHARALSLPAAERDALVERVRAWSGISPQPRDSHRALTTAEVRGLASRPDCAIGAHTTHHLMLPAQPPAIQRSEIAANKAELERVLARPVTTLSYPFGAHDAGVVETARALGFTAAVTVEDRLAVPGDDPLRLPRLEVKPEPGALFAARLDALFG